MLARSAHRETVGIAMRAFSTRICYPPGPFGVGATCTGASSRRADRSPRIIRSEPSMRRPLTLCSGCDARGASMDDFDPLAVAEAGLDLGRTARPLS